MKVEREAVKRLRRDDGMVTAELATALPVLILLALVAVVIVAVAQARVRCADAAREAARAVARGDPGAADGLARAAAGHPISVQQASGPESTTVTVSLTLHPLSWLGPITVTETAVVAAEPLP